MEPGNYAIYGWFLGPPEYLPQQISPGTLGITKLKEGFQIDFSGMLKASLNYFHGRTFDIYGNAEIEGCFSNNELFFEKRYLGRMKDVINYRFSKSGDLWVGELLERPILDGEGAYFGQPAQAQLSRIISTTSDQLKKIQPEFKKR